MSTEPAPTSPYLPTDSESTMPPAVAPVTGTLPLSTIPVNGAAPTLSAPPGYELLGELGRGGMGVVYRARQVKADRIVALKVILAGVHAGPAQLARFRTEAEAVARLQHPGIVQVFEVGEHEGLPFFSLEYCSGGSLEKKLGGTPLPAKEAAALVEKLALAVQAAHYRSVIHRDLKPANVLLAEDGTPKVTDFGLAKKLDTDDGGTRTGAVMGTPSYMSPEQAGGRSERMGTACDVYALGAILYDCLTGRPPFRAATALDTVMQVVSDEPVPPTRLNAKVPRDVETICIKCLQKDPAKRYPSAKDLAEDLRRWQAREPIAARPIGSIERAAKWARRHPTAAGLIAFGSLATVVFVIGALWVSNRLRTERDHAREQESRANLAKAAEEERARQLADALSQTTIERDAKEKARRAEAILKEEAIGNESRLREVMGRIVALFQSHAQKSGGKAIDIPALLADARAEIESSRLRNVREQIARLDATGILHLAFGKPADGIGAYEKAHELRRRHLGERHRETLISWNNLAMFHLQAGHREQGLELLKDAVQRKIDTLGATDPSTVMSMQVLARVLAEARQFDKAMALTDQILAACRETYGPDALESLAVLEEAGRLSVAAGMLDREEKCLRDILRIEEKHLGRYDQATSISMAQLARLLLGRGKAVEAEAILRDCLDVREALSRRADTPLPKWLVANTKSMLGGALLGQKKFSEAEPLLLAGCEELLKDEASIPINGKANILDAINRLIRYYEATGEAMKAAEWRVKLATAKKGG